VQATIAAARRLGRKLRVVFEPHQFARTRALLPEYAGVFDEADESLITDIHRARETDTSGVDSARLAEVAGGEGSRVHYVGGHAAARDRLVATAGDHEVWLVMGAGDVTHLAHELADWVRSHRA
jgi:UDP-N-acetylmuramate--alanine ligase